VVPINVVWVSEPVMCTLRLSLPYPTGVRKPKTLVLTFWTLVPESFGNFQKHAPLYNRRFFWGGGGEGFYIHLVWWERDPIVIPSLRTAAMRCGDQNLVCTPDRCGNRGDTPVARCFTGLSLPHPPKPYHRHRDLLNWNRKGIQHCRNMHKHVTFSFGHRKSRDDCKHL
jgi:hypothetical protein